jgi:hypothetical protein
MTFARWCAILVATVVSVGALAGGATAVSGSPRYFVGRIGDDAAIAFAIRGGKVVFHEFWTPVRCRGLEDYPDVDFSLPPTVLHGRRFASRVEDGGRFYRIRFSSKGVLADGRAHGTSRAKVSAHRRGPRRGLKYRCKVGPMDWRAHEVDLAGWRSFYRGYHFVPPKIGSS